MCYVISIKHSRITGVRNISIQASPQKLPLKSGRVNTMTARVSHSTFFCPLRRHVWHDNAWRIIPKQKKTNAENEWKCRLFSCQLKLWWCDIRWKWPRPQCQLGFSAASLIMYVKISQDLRLVLGVWNKTHDPRCQPCQSICSIFPLKDPSDSIPIDLCANALLIFFFLHSKYVNYPQICLNIWLILSNPCIQWKTRDRNLHLTTCCASSLWALNGLLCFIHIFPFDFKN